MNALLEFIKNDQIQLATASGACIIILAVFFKKIMHIPVPFLEASLPGFMFCIYEATRKKGASTGRIWSKPWLYAALMFLVTGLVIFRRLLMTD